MHVSKILFLLRECQVKRSILFARSGILKHSEMYSYRPCWLSSLVYTCSRPAVWFYLTLMFWYCKGCALCRWLADSGKPREGTTLTKQGISLSELSYDYRGHTCQQDIAYQWNSWAGTSLTVETLCSSGAIKCQYFLWLRNFTRGVEKKDHRTILVSSVKSGRQLMAYLGLGRWLNMAEMCADFSW